MGLVPEWQFLAGSVELQHLKGLVHSLHIFKGPTERGYTGVFIADIR